MLAVCMRARNINSESKRSTLKGNQNHWKLRMLLLRRILTVNPTDQASLYPRIGTRVAPFSSGLHPNQTMELLSLLILSRRRISTVPNGRRVLNSLATNVKAK
uniref:Uncharacterized protein n=1 Tax=Cacopsylla melanoneura TaxID=428564 RepID=A0A8D8S5P7_9HEMI